MSQLSDIDHKVGEFFAKYPERSFAARQIIIHAGEEPPGILRLEQGRVSQYDISSAGVQVVVNIFQPPAFFPMSWAINKTPNQYFFEASSPVVARQAPAEEVVAFLKREPEVLFDLMARVYKGVDGLLRRTAHLMGGDARSRLVFELLNAAARFGEPRPAGAVFVPFKESDIARHAGLARETVNRALQSLKSDGLVEVSRSGFMLKDVKQLQDLLGSSL